jgi:hypothetical protein
MGSPPASASRRIALHAGDHRVRIRLGVLANALEIGGRLRGALTSDPDIVTGAVADGHRAIGTELTRAAVLDAVHDGFGAEPSKVCAKSSPRRKTARHKNPRARHLASFISGLPMFVA